MYILNWCSPNLISQQEDLFSWGYWVKLLENWPWLQVGMVPVAEHHQRRPVSWWANVCWWWRSHSVNAGVFHEWVYPRNPMKMDDLEVSWNWGTPKSSIWIFHCKPSILGTPIYGNPYLEVPPIGRETDDRFAGEVPLGLLAPGRHRWRGWSWGPRFGPNLNTYW